MSRMKINKKDTFGWKSLSQSIKIKPHKDKGGIITMLNEKINQTQTCIIHKIDYCFDSPYRLYRRGKNRCKYCGVKL